MNIKLGDFTYTVLSCCPVPDVAVPSDVLPEGLVMVRDFVSEDEEQTLLQCVDWHSEDSQLSEGTHLNVF